MLENRIKTQKKKCTLTNRKKERSQETEVCLYSTFKNSKGADSLNKLEFPIKVDFPDHWTPQ